MRYSKSPGEDGITTESLKVGSTTLTPHLTNLFNTILESGKVPKTMCQSNIILHKKGDKSDIGNYRPISLTSHICKTFIKVKKTGRSSATRTSRPPPDTEPNLRKIIRVYHTNVFGICGLYEGV